MTNHIERTKEMIAVMQAYVDGEEIECAGINSDEWYITHYPTFYFSRHSYRVREAPDEIDWSHVAAFYE